MTPLVIFTITWAGGIWLAQTALLDPVWLSLALPGIVVLHFGWRHDRRVKFVIWALAGLLLGALRLHISRPIFDAEHIVHYHGAGDLTLTGLVVGEPSHRDTNTQLRIAVEEVSLPSGANRPAHGRILVRAPVYSPAFHGDRVRVTGALETPPVFDSFSYREHLARQGIHSLMRESDVLVLESHAGFVPYEYLLRFKFLALERLHQILPEPESSLLAGILLGIESGIPDDLNDDFSTTGTSHIVAISGFNISIVAGVLAQLARRVTKGRGETLFALGGVWLYTLFVGASAAVVRAAVMGSVTITAKTPALGRRQHGPTSLAVAALAMTAANPLILWDLGFQLSLAATAGLILFTEPLTAGFTRLIERRTGAARAQRIVGLLNESLIVTLAAQITTTPIILAKFQRLSVITLVTNFLILPVQPFVMGTGAIALGAGLLWRPLGQLVAWSTWPFLNWSISMVRLTARVPHASVPVGRIALPALWLYFALILLLRAWYTRTHAQRQALRARLGAIPTWQHATGFALILLFVSGAYALPDRRLHVHVLDVGYGDALFITTPAGRQIVIDGGSEPRQLSTAVGRRMPFWDRQLDLVVLTAPTPERIAGLVPLLERYEVDYVATGADAGSGPSYARWTELLAQRPPGTTEVLWAGAVWEIEEDLTLRALWPPPEVEDGPLVLQLTHGEVTFLFAGGATTLVEEQLVAEAGTRLRSQVLLVPRQGAQTGTTGPFVRAVSPEVAVISTGVRGPAPQVLARLLDAEVYRTDQHGSIELLSDGRRLQVHPRH